MLSVWLPWYLLFSHLTVILLFPLFPIIYSLQCFSCGLNLVITSVLYDQFILSSKGNGGLKTNVSSSLERCPAFRAC